MTTSGIGGYNANYSTAAAGTQKPQQESGEKVEGRRPPPPPPKNEDTYTPSAEAVEALTTLEEVQEEAAATEVEAETEEAVSSESQSKGIDTDTVNMLKADLEAQTADFLNKMVSMIQGQASTAFSASFNLFADLAQGNFSVSEAEQAEAQEAISEDGYWGVEATANRIVDMAKALAGDDPDKAAEMMSAIEKGYEEAEKVWGSELPSITADTKTRIDELFAEWTGA